MPHPSRRIIASRVRKLFRDACCFSTAALCVLGAVAFVSPSPARAASDCDATPVKARKVEWVSSDMTLNGVPAEAAIVSYDRPVDDVEQAFTQYWKDHDTPTHAQRNQTTVLLSAIDEHCSYTLQLPLNQTAPVRGLFSVLRLDGQKALPNRLRPSNYPLPPGDVVLDMTSNDAGKIARTLQITLGDRSAAQASETYFNQLMREGWHLLARGPALAGTSPPGYGYALAVQKNGYRLDAAFASAKGTTTVMINVVYE
jgi:hypothetical protein